MLNTISDNFISTAFINMWHNECAFLGIAGFVVFGTPGWRKSDELKMVNKAYI